jgi:hypothetical protein
VRTAFCLEKATFHALPHACIKNAVKRQKLEELFRTVGTFSHVVENDLSSFEFGISETLKAAELTLVKKVFAELQSANALGSEAPSFCERVFDTRTKCCKWVLNFKDGAGQESRMFIELPRTMRQSGDRITSSGNFLQNLLAWLSFLVKPEHMDAAVQSLLKSGGASMTYISARDGKTYKCCLVFEGDDTLAGFEEECMATPVAAEEFFQRWGWKPKLRVVPKTGDSYARFVGYDALFIDGALKLVGGYPILCPEVSRILKTKNWTTCTIPEEDLKATFHIYATFMANEFTLVQPMYNYFLAMRNDNPMSKIGQVNGVLTDMYRKHKGDLHAESDAYEMTKLELDPLLGDCPYHKRLVMAANGACSDAEWASMTGITTLEMNGADLACFVPKAWIA